VARAATHEALGFPVFAIIAPGCIEGAVSGLVFLLEGAPFTGTPVFAGPTHALLLLFVSKIKPQQNLEQRRVIKNLPALCGRG
jgi:hypothetical protein